MLGPFVGLGFFLCLAMVALNDLHESMRKLIIKPQLSRFNGYKNTRKKIGIFLANYKDWSKHGNKSNVLNTKKCEK